MIRSDSKAIFPRVALGFLAPLALAVAVGFSASVAVAAEIESSIARGGRLYDKWFGEIKAAKPTADHPAYPHKGGKYGKEASWRCKECHGWDYMGKDGTYASGGHATGIKGINGMAGADPAKIVAVLKDSKHVYGDKLSADDLKDLAMFVSKGQVDVDKYIDRKTKQPIGGDKTRGAAYFNTVCAKCHGEDGTKPKDMDKPLGAQMSNPWEVMHKIMNAQPAEQMPALRAFGMQPVLDIMDHITTLPKKK